MPRKSPIHFQQLYAAFNAPVIDIDCGLKCAPHNPAGIPFCCDICHAVPIAYRSEWMYLKANSSLWHLWRGDECDCEETAKRQLIEQTPPHLCLLACKGPAECEREYRAVSCRQFPFFPYFTSDYRFIGMTYDWEFNQKCWVISHLPEVTSVYRREFFAAFDRIFEVWLEDMDSYIELSLETREHYTEIRRRIPLLHRNGYDYLVSPTSERLYRVTSDRFPCFAPFISHVA